MILISVAPCFPWQFVSPTAVWKHAVFSGTPNISATTAKLCSSSSILSSLIVKNVDISNDLLLAGTVTLIASPRKSASDSDRYHA